MGRQGAGGAVAGMQGDRGLEDRDDLIEPLRGLPIQAVAVGAVLDPDPADHRHRLLEAVMDQDDTRHHEGRIRQVEGGRLSGRSSMKRTMS